MNRRMPFSLDPTWIGGIAGMLGALLVASYSLGQIPDVGGAVSDTVQGATQTTQEAASTATQTATDATKSATDSASQTTQSATDAASQTTKSATGTANQATKSATETARDATRSATDSARDASRNATGTARDAANNATRTGRDAAKSATETTRDATRNATGTARDATRTATDAARDVTRDATDATRDATRNATGTARDATRTATDAARDTTRTATDAARDTTRNATDAARSATETARDATRNATDTATDATRNATETARDATRNATDTARDAAQDVRDTARDVNRDVRDTVNDARSTVRDTTQNVIDSTRSSLNANSSVNFSNVRSADLGLWFDRSSRDGLVIADVAANTALARVGFLEGDRIVSVNGQAITTERDFVRLITPANVRTPVNVIVMRGGVQETLVIDPVVLRQSYSTVQVDPLERFGLILDDRITDRLIVWRVIPRSPAFYAGIRAGDEITMFANQRISDPTQFVQIVEQASPGMIPVQISRSGRVRTFEVDYPQVSEQRTSYRQDLDAATGINIQSGSTNSNSNLRGQVDAGVDANLNTPAGSVRSNTNAAGQVDTELPVPSTSNAQPRSSQPYYNNNSGSNNQRRGIFRRGR